MKPSKKLTAKSTCHSEATPLKTQTLNLYTGWRHVHLTWSLWGLTHRWRLWWTLEELQAVCGITALALCSGRGRLCISSILGGGWAGVAAAPLLVWWRKRSPYPTSVCCRCFLSSSTSRSCRPCQQEVTSAGGGALTWASPTFFTLNFLIREVQCGTGGSALGQSWGLCIMKWTF